MKSSVITPKREELWCLQKKSCGFLTSNILLLDETDTLKFDLTSPDGTKYNIVAIYAPVGNNATYWTTLHKKTNKKP